MRRAESVFNRNGRDTTVSIRNHPAEVFRRNEVDSRNAEVNLFYEAKQGIPRSGSGPLALSSRLLQTLSLIHI